MAGIWPIYALWFKICCLVTVVSQNWNLIRQLWNPLCFFSAVVRQTMHPTSCGFKLYIHGTLYLTRISLVNSLRRIKQKDNIFRKHWNICPADSFFRYTGLQEHERMRMSYHTENNCTLLLDHLNKVSDWCKTPKETLQMKANHLVFAYHLLPVFVMDSNIFLLPQVRCLLFVF